MHTFNTSRPNRGGFLTTGARTDAARPEREQLRGRGPRRNGPRRLQGPARAGQIAKFAYAEFAFSATGRGSREGRSWRSRCRRSATARSAGPERKHLSGSTLRRGRVPRNAIVRTASRDECLRGHCDRPSISVLAPPSSPLRSPARGSSGRSLSTNALVVPRARFARTGRSVLARIEQAPPSPSAEEQGFRPFTYGAVAAARAAGLVNGEWEVSAVAPGEPCLRVRAGMRVSCLGGRLCPIEAAQDRQRDPWPLRSPMSSLTRSSTQRRIRHVLAALCALARVPVGPGCRVMFVD